MSIYKHHSLYSQALAAPSANFICAPPEKHRRVGSEIDYWVLTKTGYYDARIERLIELRVTLYVEEDWLFFEYTEWDDIDHWVKSEYCINREHFNEEEWGRFSSEHVRQRQKEIEAERKEVEAERKTRKAEKARNARKARRGQKTTQLQRRRASGR